MMMPGGFWRHDECRRDWSFRTLTGEVELALLEAGRDRGSVPQRVTAVLSAALAELGGAAVHPDAVRALSVADRQFLMRRLAVELGMEESWIAATCPECGAAFDLPVRHGELPAKPAGEGYPFATVETSLGPVRFRVPDGADQEAVASIPDPWEARRALASRCAENLAGELSEDDLDRAEAALEAVAPEVVTRAQAACPDCGRPAEVVLDPYVCLGSADGGGLFLDVHTLASVYHWSEREILAMPRERRRLYLSLVDQSRGMVS